MRTKLFLFRIKVRGTRLWCHAGNSDEAFADFMRQTGEPLYEYCLEWEYPKNLDGTPITEAEYSVIRNGQFVLASD